MQLETNKKLRWTILTSEKADCKADTITRQKGTLNNYKISLIKEDITSDKLYVPNSRQLNI